MDKENILFWGCTHFNHSCEHWDTPLWKMRGFKSIKEHNEILIKNWNQKATNNTSAFLLGDVMFGLGGEPKFLEFISRLKGKEFYIMRGNHGAGYPKRNSSSFEFNEKHIRLIPDYFEFKFSKKFIVLCHYPLLTWNKQNHGSYMLYSHVHGNLSNTPLGRSYENSGARCLEVSVEGSLKHLTKPEPFSLQDIDKILSNRKIPENNYEA